jgi:hypothetical protein
MMNEEDLDILRRYHPIFLAMTLQVMIYALQALITMAEVEG